MTEMHKIGVCPTCGAKTTFGGMYHYCPNCGILDGTSTDVEEVE